ncbi:MAG: CDP-glucose 4,6-dehydratase [Pirellula sp.]|nr:CDP-glucose 4,6-dehydratase [Pirellula sp.]
MRDVLGAYRGAKVLLTGHTGFKGAWLAKWLVMHGAQVIGYSLPPEGEPSLYRALKLDGQIESLIGDLRDSRSLAEIVSRVNPDFVFHLAAQSLVRRSYKDPVGTFSTNVTGTMNVLEAVRQLGDQGEVCQVIVITSDKCYRNLERNHPYVETDPLGGSDPYSCSKAMAELVVESYRHSYFSPGKSSVRIASARAGNVIGGGDWAEDRIVPDCIRALQRGAPIPIRNPMACRPWQHVLEPLYGYLRLGMMLKESRAQDELASLCSPFNFGPAPESNRTVDSLVDQILVNWQGSKEIIQPDFAPHEATLLHLSTDKAGSILNWRPMWDFETTIRQTVSWYKQVLGGESASIVTEQQLKEFESGLVTNSSSTGSSSSNSSSTAPSYTNSNQSPLS